MPKANDPEVKIGARFPQWLVDLIDSRANELSKQRGGRIKRSAALREIVYTALAPKQQAA